MEATPTAVIALSALLAAATFPAAVGAHTNVPTDTPDAPTAIPTPSAALEDGLLDAIDGPTGVIVHATDRPSLDDALAAADVDVVYRYENVPAAYVVADASAVAALGQTDEVTFVEQASKSVEYHLDTATATSRAREVFDPAYEQPVIDEPSPPQTDADGNPIDGSGVGIAVVDSGLDATHPGFQEPGKVQANYVMAPDGTAVDVGPYSEMGAGHGTKLAGVAAGTGAGGVGDLRGASPGASLYGFSIEPRTLDGIAGSAASNAHEAGTTLLASMAYDWILSNGQDLDPEIRIVLSGWSCSDPACGDERQAHLQLAERLADEGFVVVFPVGNGAGEGLLDATSVESTLPTPGVVGVAGYSDEGPGDRDNCASPISSRGLAFDPSTWPDVAAPSASVMSPNAIAAQPDTRVPAGGESPTDDRKAYTRGTGTSIGAAHIAGVAALMLQANSSLDASEVERILENTAHQSEPLTDGGHCPSEFLKVDPSNPQHGANDGLGHGLVDAMDAVEAARTFEGLADPGEPTGTFPADYVHEDAVVSPDEGQVFYLKGEDQLSRSAPVDAQPRVRPLPFGDSLVHTTEIQETHRVGGLRRGLDGQPRSRHELGRLLPDQHVRRFGREDRR